MNERTSTQITNNRRLAFGPTDRLMNMSRIKYPWAIDVYERQEANTWFQKSVPMNDDKQCYREKLTPAERTAYDRSLAFLSNLDGIQFNNLVSNIGLHITAPEVSLMLTRQAAEEGVHVRAYQTMIQSVSMDPEGIYMMFERDGILFKKNSYIMAQSDVLKETPNKANFARAIIGNIVLEGVYFYSGFLNFYVLARNGKMIGSADMIKYIQRDEETHLDGFVNMHYTFALENPEVYDAQFWDDAEKLFRDAVELEITWGTYNVSGGFAGMSGAVVDAFVKTIANDRWAMIRPGEVLYPGVVNPTPWFKQFSQVNGDRANFFEARVTSYSQGMEW